MKEPLHDDFLAHGYTKCPMCGKELKPITNKIIPSRYVDDDSTEIEIKEIYPFQKDE